MSEENSDSTTSVDRVVHTPGPWKVKSRFDIYEDTLQPGVGGTYIGTTRGNGELPESVKRRCEADAKLIAEAPGMLAALKAVVISLDSLGDLGTNLTARKIAANQIFDTTGEVV